MTDVATLSAPAQQIVGALEAAAQNHVAMKGYGYAIATETQVGGDAGLTDELLEGVAELHEAGYDIRVSQGSSMRMLQLVDRTGAPVRLAATR